jgi:hypothetical protein
MAMPFDLNPLDLLLGPAMRHPQPPREGEVPGSRVPSLDPWKAAGALGVVAAALWAIRRATAPRRG